MNFDYGENIVGAKISEQERKNYKILFLFEIKKSNDSSTTAAI